MKQTRKYNQILVLAIAMCVLTTTAGFAQGSNSKAASDFKTLLRQIAGYNYGDSREPLSELRILISSSLDSKESILGIEKEAISFLESDATFAGKQFVCEQLSIIGTAESVPVLTKMLSDDKTSDIALFALQRISDTGVDKALLKAMSKVEGKTKVGVINTIGERKDAKAAGELGKLLSDSNSQIAISSAVALGKIADESSMKALGKAKANASGELRTRILDSYLCCAHKMLEQGKSSEASSIYKDLYENEKKTNIRAAALVGLVEINKENPSDIILAALNTDNRGLHSVAAGAVRELPESANLKKIIAGCSDLQSQAQIQLFSAFAHRGETAAHQAAIRATKHEDENVQAAALSALAKIGDESDIPFLVKVATEGSGIAQGAARGSLNRLPGESVNKKIVELIEDADTGVKAELVRCLGERNASEATETLLKTAVDSDRSVRRESIKSLAIVASPEAVDELIQIVLNEKNNGVLSEAKRTLVLVSQKNKDTASQAKPVLNMLPSVKSGEARGSLLEVLGSIGGESSMAVLKKELNSKDPENQKSAIRALSVWPNAEPRDDLLKIAKTHDDKAQRTLALRGYINLLGTGGRRRGNETIKLYLEAMEIATEANEKRMILSGLGRSYSVEALKAIAKFIDDPSIKAEAEAALRSPLRELRDRDKERLKRMIDGEVKATLEKILNNAENNELREWVTEIFEKVE